MKLLPVAIVTQLCTGSKMQQKHDDGAPSHPDSTSQRPAEVELCLLRTQKYDNQAEDGYEPGPASRDLEAVYSDWCEYLDRP